MPSDAPVAAGLRDSTGASSSGGAQRSASSGDKSLVSSSAESLYRCCAECRLSPENAVARGRRVIVPTEPSMSRGLLPHIIPAH